MKHLMQGQNLGITRNWATILLKLPAVTLLLATACVHAETENDVQFEVQVTGYAGRGAGNSLLATQIYAEKALPLQDVSAFLVVHHDKEFRAVYAGLARKFGELQIGIGVGNAWYDQIRHPTINPWLYYATDDVDLYLTAERYSRESTEPWLYKGYASQRVTGQFSVGLYGEKGLGAGPMISWRNGNIRIWAAVPLVDRTDAGARGIAGVQFGF